MIVAWRRCCVGARAMRRSAPTTTHATARRQFLSLLRQLDRADLEQDLHVVMDDYATHKTAGVKASLDRHPASTCTSP